jgi:hypothetical protein
MHIFTIVYICTGSVTVGPAVSCGSFQISRLLTSLQPRADAPDKYRNGLLKKVKLNWIDARLAAVAGKALSPSRDTLLTRIQESFLVRSANATVPLICTRMHLLLSNPPLLKVKSVGLDSMGPKSWLARIYAFLGKVQVPHANTGGRTSDNVMQ